MRTVEIHFAQTVDASRFEGLAGVKDVQVLGDIMRCSITGQMDPLIKAIAAYEVVNLETREQSLEDIFLAFYGNGGASAPEGGDTGA
jgi:ABC-2 type transport system ATP-binding protein